jgi:uracil-DNA glycosylase family 4
VTQRQRCPTCPNRFNPVIGGRGEPGGCAIVGQAPGYYESRRGKVFIGKSGELLEETLKQVDLGPTYLTNAVTCAWPDDEPTPEAVVACRESLLDELREMRVTKVLAMGNAAIQALCPGSKVVTALRPNRLFSKGWHKKPDGSIGPEFEFPVVPTFNMAYVLKDADVFRDVVSDIEILRTVDTWVEPPAPKYTIVTDRNQFTRMLCEIDTSHHLSVDIESSAFNPVEDTLLSVGIGDGTHVWILDLENGLLDDKFIRSNLEMFIRDNRFVGQNWYQFDWKWFWVKYHLDWDVEFDTMLAHYTLDERQSGHNLKAMCKQYLGYPDYAVDIKGKFENYGDIPRDQLYQYQAWDVQGTWELYEVLCTEMRADDPDLMRVHDEILLPASKAFGILELNGVTLDVPYLGRVVQDVREKMEEMVGELQEISDREGATDLRGAIDHEISCRERFEWAEQAHKNKEISGKEKIAIRKEWTKSKVDLEKQKFSPGSHLKVKRLVWDTLHLTPDTTRVGLEAVEHLHRAPYLISFYRQLARLDGTYGTGLLVRLWSSDRRLHGDFILIGTRTGRISSRDPNLQNMPLLVGPVIRNAFISTPGWVLGEADNSQVEIRIAGVLSRDTNLIELYKRGGDIHREVAAQMYSKDPADVTSGERQDAKPVDFSILYGATAESLVGTGEPPWDFAKAQQAVQGFYDAFPDLARHFELWKREVRRDGFLKTLSGRVRRFPLITPENRGEIERISINSRIQGSASDHLLQALTTIQLNLFARSTVTLEGTGEEFTLNPDECRLLLTVHDSILFEALPHVFEKYAMYIRQEMKVTHFETHGMPFDTEVKAGIRWGTLKKWEPGMVIDLEDDSTQLPLEYHYVSADRVPRPLDSGPNEEERIRRQASSSGRHKVGVAV